MKVVKQNKMKLQMSKISAHNVRNNFLKKNKYRKIQEIIRNLFIAQL